MSEIEQLVAAAIARNRGDDPSREEDMECALDDARVALSVLTPIEGGEYVLRVPEGGIKDEDQIDYLIDAVQGLEERTGARFTVLTSAVSVERRPNPSRLARTRDELRPLVVDALDGVFGGGAEAGSLVELADAVLGPVGERLEAWEAKVRGMEEGIATALTSLDLNRVEAEGTTAEVRRSDGRVVVEQAASAWLADATAECRSILAAVLDGGWDDPVFDAVAEDGDEEDDDG